MFLLEQVVNGLVLGGYNRLIALGLSLIFSVGGIVNLAHGALRRRYIAVELQKLPRLRHGNFNLSYLRRLLGILFERFIWWRFYNADPILSLLVTFGLP
jgi:branched-chain amino acid transport system permease protein